MLSVFKLHVKCILKCRKIRKINSELLWVPGVVLLKTYIFCVVYKIAKFGAKKTFLQDIFRFLHNPRKMSVLLET